ncbi:MAG: histidine phosphatase family protein [Pseudomonadota bacterium]
MKLLVLRHATTAWNRARLLQGRHDQPLAPEGLTEAAGWHLPYWAKDWPVLTSPLRRAQQTAEAMGLPYQVADWLIEMDWGRWEGQRLAHLRRELGPTMARQEARGLDMTPTGGESPRHVRDRLDAGLSRLALQERHQPAPPPGHPRQYAHWVVGRGSGPVLCASKDKTGLVAVAHKGVLRALLSLATGWDMTQPWPLAFRPGCGHLFVLDAQRRLRLVALNLELSP